MAASAAISTVLFDDQCPFCVAQVRVLRRLDWFRRLSFLACSDSGALRQATGLKQEALLASMHCIAPSGRIYCGARAFRFMAVRLPLLFPLGLLLWLPGLIVPAQWVYERVAVNRLVLSRFFGCQGQCPIRPGAGPGGRSEAEAIPGEVPGTGVRLR